MKRHIDKLKQIYSMMTSREGTLFTYAFAYSLLVGIAPFLIIFVVFIGNYAFEVDQMVAFLARYIPGDLIEPFIQYVSASNIQNRWLLITLLGVSIWVGSKSIYSFLLLSSEQDNVYINGIIMRILSVFYLLILVLAVIGIGLVMGYLNLANRFIITPVLILFFAIFYRITSFRYRRFHDVLPGAVATSVILLFLGQFFFVYINKYSNYQNIYGPLASMMVLLISCWIISCVIYLGYVINVTYRDVSDPDRKRRYIEFLEKK